MVSYAPENLSDAIVKFLGVSTEFFVLQICRGELVLVPFGKLDWGLKKEVTLAIPFSKIRDVEMKKAGLNDYLTIRTEEDVITLSIQQKELSFLRSSGILGGSWHGENMDETIKMLQELPKGQTMTEVKQFDYHKVVGLYAKTKAAATALVLRAAEKGLDASVVHPSGIIGPFDPGHGHLTQLVIDYCKGSLTAGVKGGYDFVDVRDVADGVLSCCNVGRRGECYFLTNRCYTLKEVLDLCSSITGRKPIRTYLPMWFARGTAGFSEIYYKLRRQPPLYTSYSLYTVSGNAAFSHRKADRELGYHPRPLKDTLRDGIGWLEMLGRIPPQKGLDFQRAQAHG